MIALNKSFNKKLVKGFTLLELLIVIAVVGVMASFGVNTFRKSQSAARDANRKSDIGQFRTALEAYANRGSNLYPARDNNGGVAASTVLCTDLGLTNCPVDKKQSTDATFTYRYQSDGGATGGPVGTQYVLWAKLEATTDNWVVCSNGKAGTRAQSGFNVNNGNCPI